MDAKNGYIITNHHVVENASEITITLLDNRSFAAKVIGSDEGADIAVLQAKQPNLVAMALGDSAHLEVGDFVVAIGNPFGLQHTVTAGIVSALGRSGINPEGYEDFIQTDASINPGNSGGALVNLKGELVGINSAILSGSGGNIGIGFAIPVNMVKGVMDQLIKYGQVKRGVLGVNIYNVTPEIAKEFGLPDSSGALVAGVAPGSSAERAGIKTGDIITSINGRDHEGLGRAAQRHRYAAGGRQSGHRPVARRQAPPSHRLDRGAQRGRVGERGGYQPGPRGCGPRRRAATAAASWCDRCRTAVPRRKPASRRMI